MTITFKDVESYVGKAESLHIEVVYNTVGYERGAETQAKFIYHFGFGKDKDEAIITRVSYLNDGDYSRHVQESQKALDMFSPDSKLSIVDNVHGKEYDTFF